MMNNVDNSSPSSFMGKFSTSSEFSHRLRRAVIAGITAVLIYVLWLRQSYAPIFGDLLLGFIFRSQYYSWLTMDDSRYTFALHLTNAAIWFMLGAAPFLLFQRIRLSIIVWLTIVFGLVVCGFLMMLALYPA